MSLLFPIRCSSNNLLKSQVCIEGRGKYQLITVRVKDRQLAHIPGLVCYILYYRLNQTSRFWNGLLPLLVDAGVVMAFLMVLALF